MNIITEGHTYNGSLSFTFFSQMSKKLSLDEAGAILLRGNEILIKPFVRCTDDNINSILHINRLLLDIFSSMHFEYTKSTNIQRAFDVNLKLIEDVRKCKKYDMMGRKSI